MKNKRTFKKQRKYFKIDTLPKDIKTQVDKMLADKTITYSEISTFLEDKGYSISISSISRYALDRSKTLDKILQAQEEMKIVLEHVKENPEDDYTEAGLQILVTELTKKIANATSDIDTMEIGEAIKLFDKLSKTNNSKRKIENDIANKRDIGFKEFEKTIIELIGDDDRLLNKFAEVLEGLKEKTDDGY